MNYFTNYNINKISSHKQQLYDKNNNTNKDYISDINYVIN